MNKIETVKDLIKELKKYSENSKILATWEGITTEIKVFQEDNGLVLLDVDQGY